MTTFMNSALGLCLLSLVMMLGGCELVGCPDGDCTGVCDGGTCTDDDDTGEDDDTGGEFQTATLHIQSPTMGTRPDYMSTAPADLDWRGDFQVQSIVIHENDTECFYEVDAPATNLRVGLSGDGFRCAPNFVTVSSSDSGAELDVIWDSPYTCATDPDGEYGTYDVNTTLGDNDEVLIQIGALMPAEIIGNEFHSEGEDGTLMEGTVAWDLSEIQFHAINSVGNELNVTVFQND
jgi:hypothetical protein